MPKKLPSDIQSSVKALLENSVDPAVIGKRVGVHRNTVNRYANTVAVKIGRMFSYFAYTDYLLLHFLAHYNNICIIRKSKL
ncbi:hypothetical protein G6F43_013565 [Rhizopus delemar]|nr:hypothetical protein G6F43_014131 [Rhizopus delemar]KAG1033476.1 hypothetical protein G6F43_013565 [Rhizopus delemar]